MTRPNEKEVSTTTKQACYAQSRIQDTIIESQSRLAVQTLTATKKIEPQQQIKHYTRDKYIAMSRVSMNEPSSNVQPNGTLEINT